METGLDQNQSLWKLNSLNVMKHVTLKRTVQVKI
jgi:hypothetical protein